jgi:glucan phosphorylase
MDILQTGTTFEIETLGDDRASLRRSLSNRLVYSIGKNPITATTRDWFNTAAYTVRERLIEHWMETMRSYYRSDAKRVYYLSMEFLTGRLLSNSLAVRDRLAVAFIPDYGVSVAERIIPGCDLSEQISTAGTEASGTGNMKLALNGALTIGTLDGDNAEIKQALDQIGGNYFSVDAPDRFRPIVDALTRNGDPFFVLADYESYAACQQRVDELYRDPDEWTRRAILNIAGMGRFSSDRAVLEYSNSIWTVNPVRH